jgi:hypothetical protein
MAASWNSEALIVNVGTCDELFTMPLPVIDSVGLVSGTRLNE